MVVDPDARGSVVVLLATGPFSFRGHKTIKMEVVVNKSPLTSTLFEPEHIRKKSFGFKATFLRRAINDRKKERSLFLFGGRNPSAGDKEIGGDLIYVLEGFDGYADSAVCC